MLNFPLSISKSKGRRLFHCSFVYSLATIVYSYVVVRVSAPRPLEGKLSLNNKLDDVEFWHKGDFTGAECFADYDGELYTGINGGDVIKLTNGHVTPVAKFGKPCKGLYEEKICGRPLGLTFDKTGALYVADAYYGIFKVNVKTGEKVRLISPQEEVNGEKLKLFNSLTVSENGDIYWTVSSTEFFLEDGLFDVLADGSGKLMRYDAKTKKISVLLDHLHFANGVALSKKEDFVVVAETVRNRIHRYYLKGANEGKSDVFLDGLPGMPDNLKADGRGGFFVPLVTPADADRPLISQSLGRFPLVRRMLARVLGLTELGFKLIDRMYPNEVCQRGIHFVS